MKIYTTYEGTEAELDRLEELLRNARFAFCRDIDSCVVEWSPENLHQLELALGIGGDEVARRFETHAFVYGPSSPWSERVVKH